MRDDADVYSLPRWRLTRWLTDAGSGVSDDIRVELIGGLFRSLPVFAGGVINTLVVSAAIAARMQTAPFIAWFVFELIICVTRLSVLIVARRAVSEHRETPTDIYIVLGLAWSVNVGYGLIISMASGDWVAATLAGLSAAAMVGGICFRNFSAPRFVAVMILVSLGPALPGAMLGGEPLIYVVFLQVPMYLIAMTIAAFKLNKMLVATMSAERENDRRARLDALTGLSNRSGLDDAIARKREAAALFYLDLDDFKIVNDTYGHAAGDELLKLIADRLSGILRTSDVAARVGGDEFVVLAEGLSRDQAWAMGQRLLAAVSAPYDLGDGISVNIGICVGIAIAPEHGTALDDLVAVADAALYEAKSTGKSRCCMASPTINLANARRMLQEKKAGGAKRVVSAA